MAIVGPTATGKSALAMELAERTEAEILSVDSMQVYRGMDIGTAKPSDEDRRLVRHHMIDVADPATHFTVAEFRRQARAALAQTVAPVVLIVGGSGLHLRSVLDPMTFLPRDSEVRRRLETESPEELVSELLEADAAAGSHVDLANPRRVLRAVEALRVSGLTPSHWALSRERRRFEAYEPELEFVGVALDRDDLIGPVKQRLTHMRSHGFLDEVEELAPRLGRTASQAVGYKQLLAVVAGEATVEEGFEAAERATMRLVKQQRTFFRRDPRLRWFEAGEGDLVDAVMKETGL